MKTRRLFQIVLLLLVIAGCDLQRGPQEFKSASGLSEIQVPAGWNKTTGLNEVADLQALNRRKNLYVVVISEEKKNFAGLNLEQYSAQTRAPMVEKLKSVVVTQPSQFKINEMEAMQFRISGIFENKSLVHFHVAVEGREHFHQLIAWSTQADFHQHEEELQAIIRSFRELKK